MIDDQERSSHPQGSIELRKTAGIAGKTDGAAQSPAPAARAVQARAVGVFIVGNASVAGAGSV